MKHIDILYQNEFGIAFYWKENTKDQAALAQIVFRDMGFYLSLDEVKRFAYATQHSLQQAICKDCPAGENCRSLLLKTPSLKVDLAVSRNELYLIQDLLDKTILRMETKQYIKQALN